MKLFVWNNPYQVNYGGSCLYVIAENLRSARRLAKQSYDSSYGDIWRGKTKVDVDNLKPTRVHKLPHAECYQWSA